MGKRARLTQWLRSGRSDQSIPQTSSTTPSARSVQSNVLTTNTSTGSPQSNPSVNVRSQSVIQNPVLERTIKEYLNSLPDHEKNTFRIASQQMTNESVLDQVHKYDQDHRTNSSLRSHSESLSRFFNVINRFLQCIATIVQANPDVSAIVIGLVRGVVTVALGFVGFFDKLSDMSTRMGDYLTPLLTYSHAAAESTVIGDCLANVYIDLFTFWRSARRVFVDAHGVPRKWTSWRVFWRIQWVPFQDEFQSTENRMQHHLDVLKHTVQAVDLEISLQARREEQDQQRKDLAREREQFLTWLSDYPFEDTHSEIFSKKHPNTGDWLLRRPEFETWLNNDESGILWCYGKPGAGKSVLASNVVEHITSQRALQEYVGIAFAYYKYEVTQMQSATFILAALIKQLLRHAGPIPEGFLRVKQDAYPQSHIANPDSLRMVAEHYRLEEIFLVIDALDECPKARRPDILKCLREIMMHTGYKVKLFVTSRPEHDIDNAFENLHAPKIKIEARNLEDDINRYVKEETARLIKGSDGRKLYLTTSALQNQIVDTLTTRAEGMFLWANLQLLHLCEASECRNDLLVEEALQTLPYDLEATYQRSLTQICQQNEYRKQMAFRILKWVLHADRPLTTSELHEILQIEEPRYKGQRLDHGFFTTTCANMLEIVPIELVNVTYILRFIHYSVQEFITNEMVSNVHIRLMYDLRDAQLVNSAMARTCIDYLLASFPNETPAMDARVLSHLMEIHPFLWYAAKTFDFHVARSGTPPALIALCECLLQQSSVFLLSLLQIRSVRHVRGFAYMPDLWMTFRPVTDTVSPVMLIFSSELFNIASFQHYWKETPLAPELLPLACAEGMGDAVKHLLSTGLNVDARDRNGLTGIYRAAEVGDVAIVRLLILHGASLGACEGEFSNPLQIAAAFSHAEIVRILLEAGADVNLRGGLHCTALQAASLNSGSRTVQLLLDAGADVNIQGGEHCDALQAAARCGNRHIVRMLLDAGANVNAHGRHFGSALQATVDEEVAQLLISMGADVNYQGGSYGTALCEAANCGNEDLIRVLLHAGADINAFNSRGFVPLDIASMKGFDGIVKILLQHGAIPNSVTLHVATQYERETVVKLLLEAGAAPDGPPPTSSACLTTALSHDKPGILHLLLDHGASPTKLIASTAAYFLQNPTHSLWKLHYFPLGRGLMIAGNLDDFFYSCTLHTACCDACGGTIKCRGFACQTCIVVDVCVECMQDKKKDVDLKSCVDHEFMEVSYRNESEPWDDNLNQEVIAWLNGLVLRYPRGEVVEKDDLLDNSSG